MVFVQEFLADERGEQCEGDVDPGAPVRLHPDAGLAAAPFFAGVGSV
jgi:hypothetical protein